MSTIKNNDKGIALVTGANSGIGFETAFQLSRAGYSKVILGVRTMEKGEETKKKLLVNGSADVFETLVIDTSEVNSAIQASEQLLAKAYKINLLILNAGMSSGKRITKNSSGVDMTFASTLIGHHVLSLNLLNGGGLAEDARIIIAGSESARGDVPGINIADIDEVANNDFEGNMHETLKAFALAEYPEKYIPMDAYALAKLYVAWWARALAEKLPGGKTVNAVSPGSVMSTSFSRDQSWMMKAFMIPMLKTFGPMMGMAGPVSAAGQRYIEVAGYGVHESGKFFASPPKKLVGKLEEQKTALIEDKNMRNEAYRLIVELAGGIDYQKN